MLEKILLDKNNRMLRIGFGKNKGIWFFRIDLWYVGYRLKNIKNDNNKGVFQIFDNVNRNPSRPYYWQDPVVPKNLIRLKKIKNILNDKARKI
jgi:hypothetical protein